MKYLFFGIIAVMIIFSPMTTSADAFLPKVMNKCKTCHTFYEGEKNKIGPNLFGIMGKRAGTAEGYKRYKAFKNADFVWTDDLMDAWLSNSRNWSKDILNKSTSMSVKIKKEKQREEIIDFLNTLK